MTKYVHVSVLTLFTAILGTPAMANLQYNIVPAILHQLTHTLLVTYIITYVQHPHSLTYVRAHSYIQISAGSGMRMCSINAVSYQSEVEVKQILHMADALQVVMGQTLCSTSWGKRTCVDIQCTFAV